MENLFEVQAELRSDEGKGASRRLRHAGKVPAIVYGAGKTPVSLSLDHNKFLRHLDEDAFYSHILDIVVGGKKEQVVLKDLQRHPTSDRKIMHADFLRVKAGQALTMTVPLHFEGGDLAPGVKAGGAVSHLMAEVEVSCLPKDLPEYITIDISALELDASIHLTEISLPKGVELTALSHGQKEEMEEGARSAYDQAVVNIHTPRAAPVEEDLESEVGEEATEEGEEEATEE
ncbi:MAG: 50S ribosomal protein L25 [Chloroflexi bacterium]|nr:MAG: 50S ribosomal protein L25 [Chloroflexota bacterium]